MWLVGLTTQSHNSHRAEGKPRRLTVQGGSERLGSIRFTRGQDPFVAKNVDYVKVAIIRWPRGEVEH